MTQASGPNGIAGLEGREPFGAALTIGHKGPKGNPTDTDRFFIVLPQQNADGIRPPHPAFKAFNEATAEVRQMLSGYLIHEKVEQMFQHQLKAQILPGRPGHPNKAPVCVGDGKRAVRWDGKDPKSFIDIQCPNDLCQYRQPSPEGKPTTCKPFMRFAFRVKWKDGSPLPAPLMKFTSGAWATTSNAIGFFDYIRTQATAMGMQDYSLYGMPFSMTLARRKNAAKGQVNPVVYFSPEGDLNAFLAAQAMRRKEFSAMRPVAMLTDDNEKSWDTQHADLVTINPGLPREMK